MDRITSARVFVEIVQLGNMSKAADALGMSRSMVSRYLQEMETWANSRLLHRSTRQLSLTATGETVLLHCQQLLAVASKLEEGHLNHESQPKGLLRVSTSHFVADELIATLTQQFLALYPEVRLDIIVSNQTVDLIADRIDLAIRITSHLDPNLIARPLGLCHSLLCATPKYLSQNQTIKALHDLQTHNCLRYSNFENNVWLFNKDEEPVSTHVNGNFSANESRILLQAVLKDAGIAMLPKHSVIPHINTGELVNVLPDHQCQPLGVYGVYRSREHMPIALRKFIDFLVDHFQAIDM